MERFDDLLSESDADNIHAYLIDESWKAYLAQQVAAHPLTGPAYDWLAESATKQLSRDRIQCDTSPMSLSSSSVRAPCFSARFTAHECAADSAVPGLAGPLGTADRT